MLRLVWIGGGITALAIGVLGIFLPLLPTTPFLLLAAFCFSRGSRRLHNWLLNHKLLGPPIRDWNRWGAIAPGAKAGAMIALIAIIALSLFAGVSRLVLAVQIVVLAGVAAFILSRPAPPKDAPRARQNDRS